MDSRADRAPSWKSTLRSTWPAWLPLTAVIPVGLASRVEARSSIALGFAAIAVAIAGLAFAVAVARLAGRRISRRRAFAAIAINVSLLTVAGLGVAKGARERSAEDARAASKKSAERADASRGGWVGGGVIDNARIQATELGPDTNLGRLLHESFAEPFIPVVLTIENGGPTELVADVAKVTLQHADGRVRAALLRSRVLASAHDAAAELQAMHAGIYRVPPGARLGNGLIFVAPDEQLEDVVSLSLVIDGRPFALRGRYLTTEEKRALMGGSPRP